MNDSRIEKISLLISTLASILIILDHLPEQFKGLRRFMENNPWIKGWIPIFLQVSVVVLSLIAIHLYLKNRRVRATGLVLFLIVVTSFLIRDAVVTVGMLLLLGVGIASHWVWTRKPWRRREIHWNPPKVADVQSEIRRREYAGSLEKSEANSLRTAIDGLDSSDLELLRIIDETDFVTSVRGGSSPIDSFADLATKLSEKVPDLGGKNSCKGRLRKLEQNGLIKAEKTWSEASRFTTPLGQRVVRMVQEASE